MAEPPRAPRGPQGHRREGEEAVSGIEPRRRAQIEQVLGRELTDDELRPVASLDALSEVQRAVVTFLGPRSVTISTAYVTGVVRDVRFADASRFIDEIPLVNFNEIKLKAI